MSPKQYIYHLATWQEVLALGDSYRICPQCGQKRYKPFVNEVGVPINRNCGRCERENSCGYYVSPHGWLKDHPEDRPTGMDSDIHPIERHQKKMIILPSSYVMDKMKNIKDNALVKWLYSLPLTKKQQLQLDFWLHAYGIGNGAHGETIFWQIDSEDRVRSGKMMKYLSNGHRDKTRYPSWVHSRLISNHFIDGEKFEYVGCLFGEHLLNTFPKATVNIVESEKTALICSIVEKDMKKNIWMATGGMMQLNESHLLPLIKGKRTVICYPDHDGYGKWTEKIEGIEYDKIFVTDFVEKNWKEGLDADNADVADIIIRMIMPTETESEEAHRLLHLKEKNPIMPRIMFCCVSPLTFTGEGFLFTVIPKRQFALFV